MILFVDTSSLQLQAFAIHHTRTQHTACVLLNTRYIENVFFFLTRFFVKQKVKSEKQRRRVGITFINGQKYRHTIESMQKT